jgi:hypothetical protein
MHWW